MYTKFKPEQNHAEKPGLQIKCRPIWRHKNGFSREKGRLGSLPGCWFSLKKLVLSCFCAAGWQCGKTPLHGSIHPLCGAVIFAELPRGDADIAAEPLVEMALRVEADDLGDLRNAVIRRD